MKMAILLDLYPFLFEIEFLWMVSRKMQMNVKSACLFTLNLIGITFVCCWLNHNVNTEADIILPYQGFCPAQKTRIDFLEFHLGRLAVKSIPVWLLIFVSWECGFQAYDLLKE